MSMEFEGGPADKALQLPTAEHSGGDVVDVNAITANILDGVFDAGIEREYKETRQDLLDEEIEALSDERNRVHDQLIAAEQRICSTLIEGRVQLWEAASVDEAYAVGVDVVANAVRLSPFNDEMESMLLREARVRVISRLSSSIQTGIPILIVRAPHQMQSRETYYAGLPEHGGFSVILEENPDFNKQFKLGINEQSILPITEALMIDSDVNDLDDSHDENVIPLIEVYAGEAVGRYVNDEVTTKTHSIVGATEAIRVLRDSDDRSKLVRSEWAREVERRERDRQGLVEIITAAKQIKVWIELDDDVRQQTLDALCEYVLDIGDRDDDDNKRRTLIEAGFALQYVYPPDTQTSMAEYLIDKSNARTQEPYSRHWVHPVVSVLQQVCGVSGQIPSNLRISH